MNTTHIYLVKRGRKLASGKRREHWYMKWKRTDGKWDWEVIGAVAEGKRRKGDDALTRNEARDAMRSKIVAMGIRKVPRNKPKRIMLADLLDEDMAAIAADVRPSTMMEYRNAYRHAVAALGPDADVTRLTHADLGRIKDHMRNPPAPPEDDDADAGSEEDAAAKKRRKQRKRWRPPAPATINKTLRAIRSAFNRAVEAEIISDHPFKKIRRMKSDPKPKRIFTDCEIASLDQAAPDLWWQTFIRLALTSGLRKNELLNLTWRDIDVDGGTVTVQAKITDTVTIKRRTYRTWNWMAKARASYRTVPIADEGETMKLLQRLRVKQGGSPYVFVGRERLKQIQRHISQTGYLPAKYDIRPLLWREFNTIQTRAAELLAEQSRKKRIDWQRGSVHDLRRTFCTRMADHVPMHVLREWAGHADIKTTNDYYLGMSEGMNDRARQAFAVAAAG